MCLSPVGITRTIAGRKYTQHVPCGKCNECIKNKQNEYVIRSIEEAAKVGKVWFFTLTYNENHVPIKFDLDGEIIDEDPDTGEVFFADSAKLKTLDRKDITAWKKRVRERLNKRRKKEGKDRIKFSFLICGEYGPKTHRPHYHGLFMGLTKSEMQEFKRDWETHFGFTQFKSINTIPVNGKNDVEATARYVAKYICKMQDLEDELVISGKVEKPRKQVSAGYGLPKEEKFNRMKDYHLCRDLFPDADLDRMYDVPQGMRLVREIIKRRRYKNNGKDYKLPNYYKRKIFYTKDEFTGKIRPLDVQRMVSRVMESDVRKDYSRKLVAMADNYKDATPSEAYFRASRDLHQAEENRRQEISEALLENNLKYLRKSKF